MKTNNNVTTVYRRNWFGFMVKVAAYDSRKFEARISTSGVLRVNPIHGDRDGVVAAYAPGEWHVCTKFVADWSAKK